MLLTIITTKIFIELSTIDEYPHTLNKCFKSVKLKHAHGNPFDHNGR